MRKMYRYFSLFVIAVCVIFALSGCMKKEAKVADYNTYSDESASSGAVDKESVRAALQQMIEGPSGDREKAVIPETVSSVKYKIDGDLVNVDFDLSFAELDNYRKILTLANVTKRLCEIENVNHVTFTVEKVPLSDSRGVAYGVFDENSFVENEGAMINAYEKAELVLYFASEDGSSLVETRESFVYSSNVSRDRLVMDKLIEGPLASGAYPTINPNTLVNVVTTRDGVCYVDLSKEFLNKTTNVTDDVMIYSIVNSLTNLTGINKVQILIDGAGDLALLEPLYERNLELVK